MSNAKLKVVSNNTPLGELRPMSTADRWGYYDGRMPQILICDKNRVLHIASYNRRVRGWRVSYNVFYTDDELMGWFPIPTVEVAE